MTNKEEFIEIFEKDIIPKIPQAKELLNFLVDETDFFTAPASTIYHSSVTGGLCLHSLCVYDRFIDLLCAEYGQNTIEDCGISFAELSLIALCHDICKIFTYKPVVKNKKVDGKWVEVPAFDYETSFILGHGAKTVYYLQRFIPTLSQQSIQALYYHMGGRDNPNEIKDSTAAFEINTAALLLHCADMMSTFIDEGLKNN